MPVAGRELVTLLSSTARSVSGNGTAVELPGSLGRAIAVLTFTGAAATEAGDTCDVYIDVSLDGAVWLNAAHFTQRAGNAGAGSTEYAVLDSANPGTSVIAVTSDAAAAAVRPALFGPYMRARWAIVDANANASHTFGVQVYVG